MLVTALSVVLTTFGSMMALAPDPGFWEHIAALGTPFFIQLVAI